MVCGNRFEPRDIAFCPAYGGADLLALLLARRPLPRCLQAARPRLGAARAPRSAAVVPSPLRPHLNGPLPRFAGIYACAAGMIGLILLGIYLQAATASPVGRTLLANAMWRAYFILVIIAGVAAWLLVLAQESRERSRRSESRRQTALLLSEITAHQRTDAELQKAKEVAEAANLAKTRFVVGISHELRTPAQRRARLRADRWSVDPAIPAHRREAIRTIRRSGEHLAGLIEGLLDISKIEAGRIAYRARRGAAGRVPRPARRHVPPAGRGKGHRLRLRTRRVPAGVWCIPTRPGCARS